MKTPSLTIVAFGNSITQAVEQPENLRWVSRLGARFARKRVTP
jgi:lysophospholipase L1-like esterase